MAALNHPENSPTNSANPLSAEIDLPISFISSSPEETINIGISLAKRLEKGSIVALKGILGAGKTCLIKGIAKSLGIEEVITSPTYTIVSEYAGICAGKENITVYHIDAYRLNGNEDFSAMGGEEIVFGNGIALIEWSERIPAFIPDTAIKVDIIITEDEKRQINIYKTREMHEHSRP